MKFHGAVGNMSNCHFHRTAGVEINEKWYPLKAFLDVLREKNKAEDVDKPCTSTSRVFLLSTKTLNGTEASSTPVEVVAEAQ